MIDLNIELDEETKTYKLPTSWADVTVEQFMEIHKIDSELKEVDMMIELLKVLSGVDKEVSKQMGYTEFTELILNFEFLKTEVPAGKKDFIIIEGEEYFIKKDFSKILMGEIISIDTLMDGGDVTPVIPEILCIFLRKKTSKGNLEQFKNSMMDRVDMFKQISIEDVHNVFFYFSGGKNILTKDMKDSLGNPKNPQVKNPDSKG